MWQSVDRFEVGGEGRRCAILHNANINVLPESMSFDQFIKTLNRKGRHEEAQKIDDVKYSQIFMPDGCCWIIIPMSGRGKKFINKFSYFRGLLRLTDCCKWVFVIFFPILSSFAFYFFFAGITMNQQNVRNNESGNEAIMIGLESLLPFRRQSVERESFWGDFCISRCAWTEKKSSQPLIFPASPLTDIASCNTLKEFSY